jgi:hypothetical protein
LGSQQQGLFLVPAATPLQAEPVPKRRRNTIGTDEAIYALVPEEVRLPDRWHVNHNRVPVLPSPKGTHASRKSTGEPRGSTYIANSPEWGRIFEPDHEIWLHSLVDSLPPSSWYDTDDEIMQSDNSNIVQTDDNMYMPQPGDVDWVEAPSVLDGDSHQD